MSNHPIQLDPETQRLAEEIDLLREELTRLLADLAHLVETVKPNLFALYQTTIGPWELRALRAQFQARRLKRKIELVQASFNRGERPDLTAIEGQLELEFLSWQAKLEEVQAQIQAAEASMKCFLSPPEDRELKTLYYALVKRLHPDLNSPPTEEQKRLWCRLQLAYRGGDLLTMRALRLLAEKITNVSPLAKPLETLRADQAILQQKIDQLLDQIETLESRPPLAWRDQLYDDDWVAARRAEKETAIEQFAAERAALESHVQRLLSGPPYERPFSQN